MAEMGGYEATEVPEALPFESGTQGTKPSQRASSWHRQRAALPCVRDTGAWGEAELN